MTIELFKRTEVELTLTTIWYVVRVSDKERFFPKEEDAKKYVENIKKHFERFGTIEPVDEPIAKEEITLPS